MDIMALSHVIYINTECKKHMCIYVSIAQAILIRCLKFDCCIVVWFLMAIQQYLTTVKTLRLYGHNGNWVLVDQERNSEQEMFFSCSHFRWNFHQLCIT